jgi:hypothetical protein
MFAPQHAAAARHVLGRSGAASEPVWMQVCTIAGESDSQHAKPGALMRSSAATEPAAAFSSTPDESQHPETPLESEAPDSGMGSIEAGLDQDLNDFDDFAHHLRVVFGGSAQLNREVERGASLGGRAHSRLQDDRSDKPPRR